MRDYSLHHGEYLTPVSSFPLVIPHLFIGVETVPCTLPILIWRHFETNLVQRLFLFYLQNSFNLMRWPSLILFVYRVIEYSVEHYHHRQTLQTKTGPNCNCFPVEWISHFLIPSIHLCLVTFLLWTESKLSSSWSSEYAELPCSLLWGNNSKRTTKPKYRTTNKCSRSSVTKGNSSSGQGNSSNNPFCSSNSADRSMGNDEIRLLEVVGEDGDDTCIDTND
jgi:hypothetical protein